MFRSIKHVAHLFIAFQPVIASSRGSGSFHAQNVSSILPYIATAIVSDDGTDLSAAFDTMIYYAPSNTSNITAHNTGLSNRQVTPSRRPIDFCISSSASFLTSHCKYTHGHYTRLQDYIVYCQEDLSQHQQQRVTSASPTPSPNPFPHHHQFPPMLSEDGACNDDEICVDGEIGEGVAYCVGKSEFKLLNEIRESSVIGKGSINSDATTVAGKGRRRRRKRAGTLGGKVARMAISERDGSTPMRAKGMDLKSGIVHGDEDKIGNDGAYDASQAGPIMMRQERSCQECFELRIGRMGDGTDFLKTEAGLTAAASAAAAGTVWLMVSG